MKDNQKLVARITTPKGDGPFLLYRSLVYNASQLLQQFDASLWPTVEPPSDGDLSNLSGPTVLYKGTYYAVELTPEAKAALNMPIDEFARAFGRFVAGREFDRIQERIHEWERQNEDGPLPGTAACTSCGSREPATQLMRLWTGERIVREYWHPECLEKAREEALK